MALQDFYMLALVYRSETMECEERRKLTEGDNTRRDKEEGYIYIYIYIISMDKERKPEF